MSPQLDNLLAINVSPSQLERLQKEFRTVHHFPDSKTPIPKDVLDSTDMYFTTTGGFPASVKSMDDMPNVKHIQLASAGCGSVYEKPMFKKYLEDGNKNGITLGTASGTHVLSIPNYVVGCVIMLYHQLPAQVNIAKNEARWCKGDEYDHSGNGHYARKTFGKTAGMLGYGALGRESARLLHAHGMRIIAANTSGKATTETDSYIIPGTSDKDGSLAEQYFSTKDEASIDEFLKQCDVLVASLPETPKTRFILNAKKLALLKPNALLINVGRGSLVKSEDILTALNAPNGLFGAALDVTDPEPLPSGHALYTHPKCIVTPHVSGDTEGEMDIATDIAVENAKRIRKGQQIYNLVDYQRGY